jgi:hypothetical protein
MWYVPAMREQRWRCSSTVGNEDIVLTLVGDEMNLRLEMGEQMISLPLDRERVDALRADLYEISTLMRPE